MKIEIHPLHSFSTRMLLQTALAMTLLPAPLAYALQKADAGCTQQHCQGDEVVVVAPGGSPATSTPPATPTPTPDPTPTPSQRPDTNNNPPATHPGGGGGGLILNPPKHGTGKTPIAASGDVWPTKPAKDPNQKDLDNSCNMFYVKFTSDDRPTTYQCYKNPLDAAQKTSCTTTYSKGSGKGPVSTCGGSTIIWQPPFDKDDKAACTGTGWFTTLGCGDKVAR